MRLNDLIQLMNNNLGTLQNYRNQFFNAGDATQVLEKDNEIAETQLIITKLQRVD